MSQNLALSSFPDEALVSPQFLADPYPLLQRLREEAPVYWSDSIGGWIVTRYDDVIVTMKQTDIYSNEGRLGKAMDHLPVEDRPRLAAFQDHYRTRGLLHSDPPVHTRLRGLIQKAFTPRMIDAMRPRIQQIVDELLDRVQPSGEMEVIDDLAFALPVTVLADIMGVPPADRVLFGRWADSLLAFQGINRPSLAILETAQAALVEARAYLQALIQKRRNAPGSDMVSQLVIAESEGDRLSEAELLNTCITFLVAGHETTTSLIGNGLYTLLAHPEQWQLLRSRPELLPAAIEEILRFECPVARQPRLVRRDTELGGQSIRTGEMVFQMLNSANRDAAHFDNPEVFDIRRERNRHIAFGFGVHFCIGAPLSRAEGTIVFETLLRRMPDIRLRSPEPDWELHKPNSRVLKSLHVEF